MNIAERRGPKFIPVSQLKPGDVILCYNDRKVSIAARLIRRLTGSMYTHAAIYLGSETVAEATKSHGATQTPLRQLLDRYKHVAVFRLKDGWSPRRVELLNEFIRDLCKNGSGYNLLGAAKYPKAKKENEASLRDRVISYFEGVNAPRAKNQGRFFCSELVTECFIKVGIISESASIVYTPSSTSPVDLVRDMTMGTFVGYVSVVKGYEIPSNDEFMTATQYHELFS